MVTQLLILFTWSLLSLWISVSSVPSMFTMITTQLSTFFSNKLYFSQIVSFLPGLLFYGGFHFQLFTYSIKLSGLVHSWPCGPPTRPSGTSDCILWLCKSQSYVDINSSGMQPDSCNKKVQSPIFPTHKGKYKKKSVNVWLINSGRKWEHFYSFLEPQSPKLQQKITLLTIILLLY